MMDCNWKLIIPPTVEPVTTADVKLHARIDHDVEDDLVDGWIVAGRELIESAMRRSIITQTWDMIFDGFPGLPYRVVNGPVQSVQSIKYYETDNTETILYDAETPVGTENEFLIDTDSDPCRIAHAYGYTWPGVTLREIASVKIRIRTGYADDAASVPGMIKQALWLYCSIANENRAGELTESAMKPFYSLLNSRRLWA
jgi:uncharacterized phiE125 gp8 family phage protein